MQPLAILFLLIPISLSIAEVSPNLVNQYCMDCHDSDTEKGHFNIEKSFSEPAFAEIMFENVITGKMPPKKKKMSAGDRAGFLNFLAKKQPQSTLETRRISAGEFNNSLKDYLGIGSNHLDTLLEDIGSYRYDTNCRIKLTREHFAAYFKTAEAALNEAFPVKNRFLKTKHWTLNKLYNGRVNGSHHTKTDGILFTAPLQRNGTFFPYFYQGFQAPEDGFYDLIITARNTYEKEHANLTFISGALYLTANQGNLNLNRFHKPLSIGGTTEKQYKTRIYLKSSEYLGLYCYNKKTLKVSAKKGIGTIIRDIKLSGPIKPSWPPQSYNSIIAGGKYETVDEGEYQRLELKNGSADLLKSSLKKASFALLGKNSVRNFESFISEYKKDKDFFKALKNGLKAIITSESFLTVKTRKLDTADTQNYLANTLWRSIPDYKLRQLDNLDEVSLENELNRLLNNSQASRMITSFCDMWLNLKDFDVDYPSLKLHPSYNLTLHRDLPHETYKYIEHIIHKDMSAKFLLDSDFLIINERIAEHYGIPNVYGHNFQKVSIPQGIKRGGLMTMASILKVTADGFQTSPILRGAWISRRILGNPVSPPPKDVEIEEPDLRNAKTIKEQMAAHLNKKTCYNCHKSIDPYGLALESFDAAGQYREKYREEKPIKATYDWNRKGHYNETSTVDASGELPEGKFSDIESMKPLLKNSTHKVAYNFARNFYEYLNGEIPSLQTRLKLWKLGDPGMKSLIISTILLSIKERSL